MVSLPIPSTVDTLDYRALRLPDGTSYRDLIDELAAKARIDGSGAHLDPDLVRGARARRTGWRPSLGQIGAVAGHLRNQRVGAGDLFLFYGWFRHTESAGGRLRFSGGSGGFHAIYGYLLIGEVIEASDIRALPRWLRDHPHAARERLAKPTNTIYVAADRLRPDAATAGAGVLRFDPSLVLTKPGTTRSRWALDASLFRTAAISYHTESAWTNGYFQSFRRAQEYVIDADDEIVRWAQDLLAAGEGRAEGREVPGS